MFKLQLKLKQHVNS